MSVRGRWLVLSCALVLAQRYSLGEEKVHIQVGTLSAPTSSVDWFKKEVSEFARANPDIDVEVVDFDKPKRPRAPLHEDLHLARNVVGIDSRLGYEVPYLVKRGLLVPIDDFLPDPRFSFAQFYESLLEPVSYNEQTWGIPWVIHTDVLVCDWELLEGAGISEPPRTWEQLLDAAQRLTRPSSDVPLWGLRFNTSNDTIPMMILSKVLQDGGWLMKNAQFDLSHPSVSGVFDYFHNLAFRSGCVKIDSRPLAMVLQDGTVRYGMHFCPAESLGDALENPNLRFAPIPSSGKPVTALRRCLYMAVRKATPEEQQASWKFIRWFCRESISVPWRYNGYPCTKSLLTRPEFRATETGRGRNVRDVFAATARVADPGDQVVGRLQGFQILWRNLAPALISGDGSEAALAKAVAQANAFLKKE